MYLFFFFLWRKRFSIIERQRLNLVMNTLTVFILYLQAFDISFFTLGGSMELPPPPHHHPLDPPQSYVLQPVVIRGPISSSLLRSGY